MRPQLSHGPDEYSGRSTQSDAHCSQIGSMLVFTLGGAENGPAKSTHANPPDGLIGLQGAIKFGAAVATVRVSLSASLSSPLPQRAPCNVWCALCVRAARSHRTAGRRRFRWSRGSALWNALKDARKIAHTATLMYALAWASQAQILCGKYTEVAAVGALSVSERRAATGRRGVEDVAHGLANICRYAGSVDGSIRWLSIAY
jgi:hypothetical protein